MTDPEHEDVKTWTSSWTYDAFLSTGSAHANFTNSVCSRIDALTPHALAVAALLRATYDLFPVPKETHTDLVIEAQAQRAPFLLIAYKEASLLAQSPIDPPFAPFLNAVRDVNDDAAEVIGDNMVKMLEDSTALPAFHDFLLDLKGLVAPVGHLGPIGSNISPTSPLGILLRRIQADAATLPFHRLPSLFRAVKEHIRDTNSTSNTVWDVPVAAAKKWVDKVTERLEVHPNLPQPSHSALPPPSSVIPHLLNHPATAGDASYISFLLATHSPSPPLIASHAARATDLLAMKRNLTGRKHAVHYILLTMAQGMAKGGDGEEAGVAASHALKLAREAQDTEGVTITTMFINQLRLTFPSASIMDPAAILPTGRKEGVDKSVQVPLYLRAVAEAAEGVEGIMAGRHPRQTFQLLSSATQHAREPLPSPSAPPSISRPEGAHHPQNPSLFSPHLAIPSTLHLSSVAHASLGSSATATHSSLLAANLSLPGAAILASCRLARGLADQGRYRDAARVLERVKTSHPDVVRGADWGEWRRCAAEITFWRALRRGELGTAEVALNVVEGESSASHSGRVDGAAAGWAGWRAGYGTVEAMRAELTRRSGDGARAAKMVEEWAASLQGLERVAAFIEVGRVRMRSSSTLSALKPLLTAITLSKRQFAHPLYWRASVLLANLLIHLGMPRRGLAVANSVVTDVITHLGAEEKGETWEVLGRCLEESVAEPVQDKRADVPGVVPPHNPSVSYRLRHASTRASLLDSSAHHYALALSCYIQSDNLEAQSRVLALQADLAHRMNRLGDRNDAAKEYLALQEVGKRRARFAGRFGKEGVTDACEQVMDEWDREGRYG